MQTDHPLTLTVEQAAELLGIGRSTAYELVHTGDIPSLRLGRRIVVPLAPLAAQLGVVPGAISNLAETARGDQSDAPRETSTGQTRPAETTLF